MYYFLFMKKKKEKMWTKRKVIEAKHLFLHSIEKVIQVWNTSLAQYCFLFTLCGMHIFVAGSVLLWSTLLFLSFSLLS